ncbi:MAG: ABC transporter permease [Anaerolineae bacterium]
MTTQSNNPQLSAASGRVIKQTQSQVWLRRFTVLAPLWTLIALGLFFGLSSPSFLRERNLSNILIQISTLAIFGTGMTFVLLTGEIDLSIAAVAGLAGMIAAQLSLTSKSEEPIPTLVALGAATLLGLISGIASTRFRIPTFMMTLAMSLMAGGLNTFVSKGRTLTEIPAIPDFLGTARIGGEGGFPVIVLVGALTLALGHVVLRYTRFGRYVYMTGANKSAARLVGVNTDVIIMAVLTICGFTAGLAGLVSMGRLGSAQPQGVDDFLINTIGAVVLGGTALTGGRGGIPQTVIGLLIYGTLRNGLDNMPWIDIYLKNFITGVVLVVALVINLLFSGKSDRDKTV